MLDNIYFIFLALMISACGTEEGGGYNSHFVVPMPEVSPSAEPSPGPLPEPDPTPRCHSGKHRCEK